MLISEMPNTATKCFSLFTLPFEVRTLIYKVVFHGSYIEIKGNINRTAPWRQGGNRVSNELERFRFEADLSHYPQSLLLTSRQTRVETLPPLNENTTIILRSIIVNYGLKAYLAMNDHKLLSKFHKLRFIPNYALTSSWNSKIAMLSNFFTQLNEISLETDLHDGGWKNPAYFLWCMHEDPSLQQLTSIRMYLSYTEGETARRLTQLVDIVDYVRDHLYRPFEAMGASYPTAQIFCRLVYPVPVSVETCANANLKDGPVELRKACYNALCRSKPCLDYTA